MAGGQKGRYGGALLHGEGKSGQRSKEYRTWCSMKRRCRQHPHYVKHGVTVCERWQSSFVEFLADVGRAPSEKHSIDRWPNPDGQYEPVNVRWATRSEQAINRRSTAVRPRPWLGKRRRVERRADGRKVCRGAL